MTYLDQIATENTADLIAAEVPNFLHMLKRNHPQNVSVACTYKQRDKNVALVTRATEELREIWRLARRGDEAWRNRLAAINTEHRGTNPVASTRWRLLIEHAPVAA